MKDKQKKQKQQRCIAQAGTTYTFNDNQYTQECLHDLGHPGDHLFVWRRVQ